MSGRTVIALDVDGVLNPLGNPAKLHRRGFIKHRDVPAGNGRFDLWLHPGHGERLLALAAHLDAELVWATTWNEHANAEVGPRVGLPELPVITVVPPLSWRPWDEHWKADAVRWWAGERPLTWLDDDLNEVDQRWARRRGETLLIKCDPRVGLTLPQLDYVATWGDGGAGPSWREGRGWK